MQQLNIVILGGGMVAGYTAKQLVELGLPKGELAILSADNAVPYERPPLSKGFLAGKDSEEAIKINPEDFYKKQGIELKLECEVATVDVKRQRLILKGSDEFGFQKLIIATGARPRTLNIPGSRLQNLFYLRTVNDSKSIRDAAEKVNYAVVIGGGFIGMEVAAVLAQKGIEVVMVLNDDRVFKRLFSPEMSSFFETYYAARGVRLIKSMSVIEFRGDEAVNSAVLRDRQTVQCELVVAGIGVQPAIEVVTNSGLDLGDGISVNEYLQRCFRSGRCGELPGCAFRKTQARRALGQRRLTWAVLCPVTHGRPNSVQACPVFLFRHFRPVIRVLGGFVWSGPSCSSWRCIEQQL